MTGTQKVLGFAIRWALTILALIAAGVDAIIEAQPHKCYSFSCHVGLKHPVAHPQWGTFAWEWAIAVAVCLLIDYSYGKRRLKA